MEFSTGITFGIRMRIFFACCAAWMLIGCGGGTKSTQKVVAEGSVLVLSDSLLQAGIACDTVELGRLHEGEVVVRNFSLLNKGNKPLVILSVETSCGCTEVNFPRQPLLPGERRPFSFSFDSRGFSGWQLKTIIIRTSTGGHSFRLFVTADVI